MFCFADGKRGQAVDYQKEIETDSSFYNFYDSVGSSSLTVEMKQVDSKVKISWREPKIKMKDPNVLVTLYKPAYPKRNDGER